MQTLSKPFLSVLTAAFILLLTFSFSTAEEIPEPPSSQWNVEQGIELPIGKTQWEIENEYLFPIIYPTDDPPPQPSLNPAEWERMTGVLIRYPLGISYSIIAEMAEDVEVVTIVSSQAQASTVYNLYQSNGVNVSNCDWLIAPSNSMWTRDYGPWFIFTGDDEQGISNHIYNRPSRPDDNRIPTVFGEAENIPVYDLPLISAGGNYMSDGMGISMSTDLVYNENPSLSQAQVDAYMQEYMGVDNYFVMDDILSGGIHHIDCWAKMIDPGRIIAKRLDPPNAQLEANVEILENTISSYGRPYEVIRIDCASSTPYTNALIMNDKVLVPLFNHYLDAAAMQTWADAMPGYEILGYTGSWVSDDAIHCRAMGITDRYMLRITHVPLFDRENNGEDYPVEADIHAYSNESLSTGMPVIMWRTDTGAYNSAPMTSQGDDIYLGYIPEQPDYSLVEYYLHAEDESGRIEEHPFIGPGNPHLFMIAPDTIAPEIVHTPLGAVHDETGPYTVEAEIYDPAGIASATVYWGTDGIVFNQSAMTNTSGNNWEGDIPGQLAGTMVYYYIESADNSTAGNISQTPIYTFVVKEVFYTYDVESGAAGWEHESPGTPWNDQWHISEGDAHSPTHAWKCGDTGTGSYGNSLDARLISPAIELMNNSDLYFWHRMDAEISGSYPDSCYDGGIVEILPDGGTEWMQIFPADGYNQYTRSTSSMPFPGTPCFSGSIDWWEERFDLSAYSGEVQVRFRFGSDGSVGDNGWFIDDVVFAGFEDTLVVPLQITMTPENPPIIIPETGGSFQYTVQIINNGISQIDYDAWIQAVLPSGDIYEILVREGLTLSAGASLQRFMTQTVPAGAPSGAYNYNGMVGQYPGLIYSQDGFTFEKLGADGYLAGIEDWRLSGWDEPLSMENTLPQSYSLAQNYPNPFNAQTTFNFTLPREGKVEFTIYNVMGQKVASLLNDHMPPGHHSVKWSADNITSGVYFYKLQTEGFVSIKKCIVLK